MLFPDGTLHLKKKWGSSLYILFFYLFSQHSTSRGFVDGNGFIIVCWTFSGFEVVRFVLAGLSKYRETSTICSYIVSVVLLLIHSIVGSTVSLTCRHWCQFFQSYNHACADVCGIHVCCAISGILIRLHFTLLSQCKILRSPFVPLMLNNMWM